MARARQSAFRVKNFHKDIEKMAVTTTRPSFDRLGRFPPSIGPVMLRFDVNRFIRSIQLISGAKRNPLSVEL